MKQLQVHSDAEEAFRTLADAGIRVITVTNGSASSTETLLDRAGLICFVERIVSVEAVGQFKPKAEVYRHAATVAGVEPGELALVASHGWDVQGAKAAGLLLGFAARGTRFPSVMEESDVLGETLSDVARASVERRAELRGPVQTNAGGR